MVLAPITIFAASVAAASILLLLLIYIRTLPPNNVAAQSRATTALGNVPELRRDPVPLSRP